MKSPRINDQIPGLVQAFCLRKGYDDYLTVSLPTIPASLWPGTEQ